MIAAEPAGAARVLSLTSEEALKRHTEAARGSKHLRFRV